MFESLASQLDRRGAPPPGWLQQLNAAQRLSDEQQAELFAALGSARLLTTAARLSLLLGAGGKSSLSPHDALAHLDRALAVFDVSGLRWEARLARSEAAGHLIEAGRPRQALVRLGEAASQQGTAAEGQDLAEAATRARALFDLGEAHAAVQHACQVLQGLPQGAIQLAPRQLQRAWSDALEVLLGAALARGSTDSSFSDGPVWALATEPGLDDGSVQAALAVGRRALRDHTDSHRQSTQDAQSSHSLRSLALAVDAMGDAAGAAARASALARKLAAQHATPAAPWLRLALAHRLAGQSAPAARCATKALAAAQGAGSFRWQRCALVELALIQHEAGHPVQADATWLALRDLGRRVSAPGSPHAELSTLHAWPGKSNRATALGPAGSSRLQQALAALDAMPPARWQVLSLAAECGVSRRTLEQTFKSELGQTVGALLRQRKVQLAQRLLAQTEHAIKRVAIDSGFSSASAFCREFRKQTGSSPVLYRQRQRKG